jgi:hypothetical protein
MIEQALAQVHDQPSFLRELLPGALGWNFPAHIEKTEEIAYGWSAAELEALRRCMRRGEPFGGRAWVAQMAAALGLSSLLRPRGRPRKAAEGQL